MCVVCVVFAYVGLLFYYVKLYFSLFLCVCVWGGWGECCVCYVLCLVLLLWCFKFLLYYVFVVVYVISVLRYVLCVVVLLWMFCCCVCLFCCIRVVFLLCYVLVLFFLQKTKTNFIIYFLKTCTCFGTRVPKPPKTTHTKTQNKYID